jgi:restriction system protein
MFDLLALIGATSVPNPNQIVRDAAGELVGIVALFAVLFMILFVPWALFRRARAKGRQKDLKNSGIFGVDQMSGREFELYLAALFRGLGYQVTHVGRQGDYGADLVIDNGRTRLAVQAKCWRRPVGINAVREAMGARAYYQCHGALVVTNSIFTHAARRQAIASGVDLWGRGELLAAMASLRKAKH